MPLVKQINPVPKLNDDTGFSTTGVLNGSRFINKDGTFNLHKRGWTFFDRFSIFYTMISLPLWQFITIIVIFFFSINLVYTGIYWWIGTDQFIGFLDNSSMGKFKELYFFSTETFTTVGYGRVNPVGDAANLIAAVEAMSGFLSFALATGLIYGRFARPRAHVAFSDHAIISPYKDKTALMFRFVCYKQNHALTDVIVQVNLAMLIRENGEPKYKYYSLALERGKIESMPMNWTVVHPIDDQSPLFGFTSEDLAVNDMEIYVLIRGFNEVYGSTVQQRTSYTYQEVQFNRKFVPMYHETAQGTVLELHKLNRHEAVPVAGKQDDVAVSFS